MKDKNDTLKSCPICDCGLTKSYTYTDEYGVEKGLYECENCGLYAESYGYDRIQITVGKFILHKSKNDSEVTKTTNNYRIRIFAEYYQKKTRTQASQWISVKGKLPEELEQNSGKKQIKVIVALKSTYPKGKHTIQSRHRQSICGQRWAWSGNDTDRITHWMLMPEPPKGDV